MRAAALCLVGLVTAWNGEAAAQISRPPGAGRPANVIADAAASRTVSVVYAVGFSFVRIEPVEAGAAPNLHPASFDRTALRELLSDVRLGSGRLFNDDELTELVPPLVTALERAMPDQDVCFAISGKHYGLGPLSPRSVTTGRLFVTADGLQFIVGLAQRPFESQYVATGHLIPFDPGRRQSAVDRSITVSVSAEAGSVRRADWLALRAPPAFTPSAGNSTQTAASGASATAPTRPLPQAASGGSPAPTTAETDALGLQKKDRQELQ